MLPTLLVATAHARDLAAPLACGVLGDLTMSQKSSSVSAYRIERMIGAGGMARVFAARHRIHGRRCALKVMREDQLAADRALDRMLREATILATMRHPGIPPLHELGLLPDGRPWIAMELVDGKSLADRLVLGPLACDEVLAVIEHVAAVLAAAHGRGIIHRDLKPDNILLVPEDPEFPLRVIDWGIAGVPQAPRWTHHDEAVGTPLYMSPEQARGDAANGESDVYGLGVVAYQALTGHTPFQGSSSVEILVKHINEPPPPLAPRCPEVPFGVVELVERMLAKRAAHRPTAHAVRARIAELRASASAPMYEAYELYAVG